MKTTRILAVLAALTLTTGLISACGSDDKATYAQEVEDILNPLGDDLQSLGSELSSASSPAELATGLGKAEKDLDDAASELQALDVPSGVEQVNQDLVDAISGFSDELAKVQQAAESGDTQKLQQTALNLPQVASDFQQKLNDIQQAAIDAGVPIKDPGSN